MERTTIIHLHRYGSGPRVVVGIHGWSGDHTTFAPLARQMPDDVTLVAVDLPGCGRSPAPPRWSIEEIGADVAHALAAEGIREATLVGNCSGALLGLVAAKHAGDMLERLVLIDPFAYFPWYFRLFTLGEFGRRAYMTTFASALGRSLTDRSLAGRRSASTSLTESFAAVDHETTLQYLLLLTQIERPETFALLPAAIDLVIGERTFGAVHRSAAIWRRVWPHARVHTLAGAGHLPIEEAPDVLARIVLDQRHQPISIDR